MNPTNPLGSDLLSQQAYVPNETERGYEFITEKGAIYEVYFGDGRIFFEDSPLAHQSQLFGFTRKKRVSRGESPIDNRIKLTIKTILYQVLEANPDMIIVFNCSTEGGKQLGRSVLFDEWFSEVRSDYIKLDYSIEATSGQTIPTSVILRADHPERSQVTPAIQAYVLSKSS